MSRRHHPVALVILVSPTPQKHGRPRVDARNAEQKMRTGTTNDGRSSPRGFIPIPLGNSLPCTQETQLAPEFRRSSIPGREVSESPQLAAAPSAVPDCESRLSRRSAWLRVGFAPTNRLGTRVERAGDQDRVNFLALPELSSLSTRPSCWSDRRTRRRASRTIPHPLAEKTESGAQASRPLMQLGSLIDGCADIERRGRAGRLTPPRFRRRGGSGEPAYRFNLR